MNIQTALQMIFAASIADDTVIMQGVHGIGKSDIVKQFCKENDYHLEELFLSHQEVGDIIGIPHTTEHETEVITNWSVPIWLKRMRDASLSGKKCLLFLDELNRASIDVRQSALQLVLERKIHEHELPTTDGCRTMVVAAVNPADEYQVDELDPALLDRFMFIEIEPDAPAFLKWARGKRLNRVVVDFISEHPDRLHWTSADNNIGASPRSWAKLAAYMDKIDNFNDEITFQIMKGKIGTELASQFYTFYKNYVDVIKIEDIEKIVNDNKDKLEKIEDIAELISELTEKTEAIQKIELAHQLSDKYMERENILPFLAYLYSLEVEICVSFLKSYFNSDSKNYKKLAKIDGELNNKKLFSRILDAAESENNNNR